MDSNRPLSDDCERRQKMGDWINLPTAIQLTDLQLCFLFYTISKHQHFFKRDGTTTLQFDRLTTHWGVECVEHQRKKG